MTQTSTPDPADDAAADDAALRAILSLFDEPAAHVLIETVLAPPMVPDLTERFARLVPPKGGLALLTRLVPGVGRKLGFAGTDADAGVIARWQAAVERGIASGAVQYTEGRLSLRSDLREAVRAELTARAPDAVRKANDRIHLVYYAAPKARMPETAPELAALGLAIRHACRAGLMRPAFDRIYLARVTRGDALHIGLELGLHEQWLEIMRPFFVEAWCAASPALGAADQAAVLAHAGVALRALGRFRDAERAIAASVEATRAVKQPLSTATAAQNLSEVRQVLGDLAGARAAAEQSVREAEIGANPFRVLSAHCRVADVAHQQGEIELARSLFVVAETRQREINKGLRYLVSLRHAYYADLLLAMGTSPIEVFKRGVFALNISNGFLGNGMTPLDVANDLLVLGRAAHAIAVAGLDPSEVLEIPPAVFAREKLDDAVTRLRVPGMIAFLPGALIARARLSRFENRRADAVGDLEEAIAHARRCEMRLALVDALVERYLLAGAEADRDEARRLIAETGYVRRSADLSSS